MKVITEPTVELIAKQEFIGSTTFEIPDDGNDAVKIGSFAAKVCYDSIGKNGRPNEENQKSVISHLHGSVLEHVNFTLYITGITRGLSLESNRHRQLAVSQRSTRYTAEEDAAIVLDPYMASLYEKYAPILIDHMDVDAVRNFDADEFTLINLHVVHQKQSINAYKDEVNMLTKLNPNKLSGFELRKWARGKARNLLPHALETRIVYTGNLRAWRWVIEARSDKHAEPEIRRLANVILLTLRTHAPLYFEDFYIDEVYDGIPVWKATYHKI